MSAGPIRVIKLGGSLLDWPGLVSAFRAWLTRQSEAADVIVVGGGALVEALRQIDRGHHFDPATMHWRAIEAMGITAAIVAELLSEATLVNSLGEIGRDCSSLCVLRVEPFLRDDARRVRALPCGWQVTSDSVAARIAGRLEAQELVLLKSSLPEGSKTCHELAEDGFVDQHFPSAVGCCPIRVVNLRSREFSEWVPRAGG